MQQVEADKIGAAEHLGKSAVHMKLLQPVAWLAAGACLVAR
jgi:hypothetical protein